MENEKIGFVEKIKCYIVSREVQLTFSLDQIEFSRFYYAMLSDCYRSIVSMCHENNRNFPYFHDHNINKSRPMIPDAHRKLQNFFLRCLRIAENLKNNFCFFVGRLIRVHRNDDRHRRKERNFFMFKDLPCLSPNNFVKLLAQLKLQLSKQEIS